MIKTALTVVTATSFALLPLTASPLEAGAELISSNEQAFSPSEKELLQQEFEKYNVDKETQELLFQKLDEGVPWDSLAGTEEPIDSLVYTDNGHEITLETYPDGSIIATEVELPAHELEAGEVAPLDWGCTYTSAGSANGGYWTGCNVTVNRLVLQMGFHLDYENVAGSSPKITNTYNYHHYCIGCSLTNHRLEQLSPTQVRYSADYAFAFEGFPLGWTNWMQANLNGSVITTTNN
ncbi:DUF5626 family protein [Gulosibacter sp. 10]|uniref:DUF5626 family protein n=1 Tax=Gulosibacter sp. 10 TaxID=1255570 RepID=UPI001123BD7F|nr:DUF5626 family protein [Gulosibacter sp. 10]